MSKTREQLKILLLQIRDDKETTLEEYYKFLELSYIEESQLILLNVFQQPEFQAEIIDDYDALYVGGSSDATVLDPKTYPFVEDCKRLIRYCFEKKIPTFASCFGFQLAVEELGGKIIFDHDNMEMGIYAIRKTPEAENDLLFGDIANDWFWAVSGHKERAVMLPQNAIHLASSELCPYHAFKFPDRPFYGFQFHPEVGCEDLHARLQRYRDRYLEDETAFQRIIDKAIYDTPESNALVNKFIERILLTEL